MSAIRTQMQELLEQGDFLPFRVCLINSCAYDVFLPWQLLLLRDHISWYGRTSEWAVFEYQSVVAVESLVEIP